MASYLKPQKDGEIIMPQQYEFLQDLWVKQPTSHVFMINVGIASKSGLKIRTEISVREFWDVIDAFQHEEFANGLFEMYDWLDKEKYKHVKD